MVFNMFYASVVLSSPWVSWLVRRARRSTSHISFPPSIGARICATLTLSPSIASSLDDIFAFTKVTEPITYLNVGVVDEEFLARAILNKTVAFFFTEPFNLIHADKFVCFYTLIDVMSLSYITQYI